MKLFCRCCIYLKKNLLVEILKRIEVKIDRDVRQNKVKFAQ